MRETRCSICRDEIDRFPDYDSVRLDIRLVYQEEWVGQNSCYLREWLFCSKCWTDKAHPALKDIGAVWTEYCPSPPPTQYPEPALDRRISGQ